MQMIQPIESDALGFRTRSVGFFLLEFVFSN